MAKLSSSNISPDQNFIINGDFNWWQRGTVFGGASVSQYTADRWRNTVSNDATESYDRSTVVPTVAESGHKSNYSLKQSVDVIDASIAAGQFSLIEYRMEGYDYTYLEGKQMTISFWVRAFQTGTYCVSITNSGQDRSYIREYTINSSDTWEKKTLTFPLDYSGGTWLYNNGIGLRIYFVLAVGSTYHGSADTWNSSLTIGTSNNVNGLSSTSNTFYLSQVQLELGPIANDFKPRPVGQEFALCQRYYEKSYNRGDNPGTTSVAGGGYNVASTTLGRATSDFQSSKRAAPTVVIYSPVTGASAKVRNENAGTDITASLASTSHHNFRFGWTSVDTNQYHWHWTADAEL